jgi:hypothetical protein
MDQLIEQMAEQIGESDFFLVKILFKNCSFSVFTLEVFFVVVVFISCTFWG